MNFYKERRVKRLTKDGALFVNSPAVKVANFSYVARRLRECSANTLCEGCPDKKDCIEAFDRRCSLGVSLCHQCNRLVPDNKYCSLCGELIHSYMSEPRISIEVARNCFNELRDGEGLAFPFV